MPVRLFLLAPYGKTSWYLDDREGLLQTHFGSGRADGVKRRLDVPHLGIPNCSARKVPTANPWAKTRGVY